MYVERTMFAVCEPTLGRMTEPEDTSAMRYRLYSMAPEDIGRTSVQTQSPGGAGRTCIICTYVDLGVLRALEV